MARTAVFAKLVEAPLAVMTAACIKNAINCWAWLMESRPETGPEWLAHLIAAWRKHVQFECGAFGLRSPASVFRRKLSTAPTTIPRSQRSLRQKACSTRPRRTSPPAAIH